MKEGIGNFFFKGRVVINYRHATPCSFVEGVALSNVENFSFSSLTWYVICILIFLQSGGHHTAEDFAVRGKEPKDEVQIYTWKYATLRELADLVLSAVSHAQSNIFTVYLITGLCSSIRFRRLLPRQGEEMQNCL